MFRDAINIGEKSPTEQKKGIARRSRWARRIDKYYNLLRFGEAQLKTGIRRLNNG